MFFEDLQSKLDVPVKLVTDELDDLDGRFTHEILEIIKSQEGVEVIQLIGMDGFFKPLL